MTNAARQYECSAAIPVRRLLAGAAAALAVISARAQHSSFQIRAAEACLRALACQPPSEPAQRCSRRGRFDDARFRASCEHTVCPGQPCHQVLLHCEATCSPPTEHAVSSIGISLGTELPLTANADYGEGANLKLPGLVPSPIRPTGPIAEYCEVVALGREDICLEEKKQVSLYEKSGGSAARSGALLSKLSAQREALLSKVLPLVEQGKLVQAERELMSPLLQELTGTVNQLASSEQALKSHLPSIKSNVQTASVACKKRDGPTAKKAISELLSGLNAFSEAASSSR
eukprot:6173368-Pleurochrysis_carterae.AAC.5